MRMRRNQIVIFCFFVWPVYFETQTEFISESHSLQVHGKLPPVFLRRILLQRNEKTLLPVSHPFRSSPSIPKNHLTGDVLHLISLISRIFFIILSFSCIMKVLALLLWLQWMDMEGARAMQGKQTNSVTVAGVERKGLF